MGDLIISCYEIAAFRVLNIHSSQPRVAAAAQPSRFAFGYAGQVTLVYSAARFQRAGNIA